MAIAPNQPDPDLQTGLQFLRGGLFDRAEPHFRLARTRYGDRPEILHYLAVCVSKRGALGEAADLWRKALAKDPQEPMLSYNLGQATRALGLLDESARRFRDTLRRQPGHVGAKLALASVHVDQGKFSAAERELAEVVAALEQEIEKTPDQANLKAAQAHARNLLGHVLYRLGHVGPAVEVLDMAAQDAGDDKIRLAQILGDRALALGAMNRHDDAIGEAQKALELAPDSASLNHVLGFVLYFAGKLSEAIPAIEKALHLDPNFAVARQTLANVLSAAGRTDEAAELLRAALARNPTDRSAVLQYSFLHLEAGRFSEALDILTPYLKAHPDDAQALNNRGLALRGLKRFDEAHAALKRASRRQEDDPLILTNLGQVLVDLGRAAEARPLHERALAALPSDARLLTNYGSCLVALGERDKARETLDAALAADPNNAKALVERVKLDA